MTGKQGRPPSSLIRKKIAILLSLIGKATGYELYKLYLVIFEKVTQRSIYYHLRKGLDYNEFVIVNVANEEGDYSWGRISRKIYYTVKKMPIDPIPKNIQEEVQKEFEKIKGK